MNFKLKITKKNIAILAFSLMILVLVGTPLFDGVSALEYMQDDELSAVSLAIFFCSLVITNICVFSDHYDIAKITSIITAVIYLFTLIDFMFIENWGSLSDLDFGGIVYAISSGVIAFLCYDEARKPNDPT